MAIEPLKRIFEVSALRRKKDILAAPGQKRGAQQKEKKKEKGKIDIKV